MSEVCKFPVVVGDNRSVASLTEEMIDRVKEVVYSYNGKVPVAVAIGVLHIAAKEILDAQHE
jgi:hypothetical protein